MNAFTHLDKRGRATMVDITHKASSFRQAVAQGVVQMQAETLLQISEQRMQKGDVISTARIAGIQGAKQCASLIPLCHPLSLSSVALEFEPDQANSEIRITATCKCQGNTGVEMEALTAVSIAALTLFDMCKAVDKSMRICGIRVLSKSGGKTGQWENENA